jgi:hypothetical protein
VCRRLLPLIVPLLCAFSARAAQINLVLADDLRLKSAAATATKSKATITGSIDSNVVHFLGVSSGIAYDVALIASDHTILQGVDLGWYSLEPANPAAEPLNDDDRQQITTILKDVPAFYNKNDLLILRGTHERAVALVQLVRDTAFHSDQGGEVIWHVELWYFKNQHGGWEKLPQVNKVLRRERFKSRGEYEDVVGHLRWTPELGGLKLAEGQAELTITLPANAGAAATGTATAPAAQ